MSLLDKIDDAMGRDGVLDEAQAFIERYVAFPNEHYAPTVALWSAHTHLADRIGVTPYLNVWSVEPESGKTTLAFIMRWLVSSGWHAIDPTEATVFRKLDNALTTLLLDETDGIFTGRGTDPNKEALRSILNAGYQKGLPVPRCVGKDHAVKDFDTYGPKALFGLKNLPHTLASRSIRLNLKKRLPNQTVEPYFVDEVREDGERLQARLAELAFAVPLDNLKSIRRELLTLGLGDRMADGWSALVAVGDHAGGEWSQKARDAARALSTRVDADLDSLGVRLLGDLRDLFKGHKALSTTEILERLNSNDEAPWGDLRGEPLDARGLARFLKPYDVTSKAVKVDGHTKKGYHVSDLSDPWSRHLGTMGNLGNLGNPSMPVSNCLVTPVTPVTPSDGESDCPGCGRDSCDDPACLPLEFTQ